MYASISDRKTQVNFDREICRLYIKNKHLHAATFKRVSNALLFHDITKNMEKK